MKIVFLALLAGFCGSASVALGQSPPAYPQKKIVYVGADGLAVADAQNAHHRLDITLRDSLSGSIREYDAAGILKEITPYADVNNLVKLGPKTTYYPNGQMRTKEDFVGDKRQGEYLMFYPEGKLKRRENYAANKRTGGECYNAQGEQVAFFEYEVMPLYKGGGPEAIGCAIQANLRYPQSAMMNGTQGRVFVSFQVSETGEVTNAKVVKGVSEALDRAALTAVNKLSAFTPGQLDGHNVSVSFTFPIIFKIGEPRVNSARPAQRSADFMNSRP